MGLDMKHNSATQGKIYRKSFFKKKTTATCQPNDNPISWWQIPEQ